MNLDLTGRRALVCGASKGIGRASALELARLGCAVTAAARTRSALEALVGELPGEGHEVLELDLDDLDAVALAATTLDERHDAVHILVNNAGGPPPGRIVDATPEDFATGMRRHLGAASVLVRALLPGMKAAGYGRILNVISTSVRIPIPGLGVSNTVRAAVASWAKTLSLEVAADGVTVNNLLPGFTDTERLRSLIAARAAKAGRSEEEVAEEMRAGVPAGRFGEAEELAAALAFLASPAAGYINGVSLPVDGGRTGSI